MDERLASVSLPARYESLKVAHRILAAILPDETGDEVRIHLEICLAEGFNNAVAHAYREAPDGVVEVRVHASAEGVRLEVIDAGTPMDEATRTRLDEATIQDQSEIPREQLAESGRGFGILQAVLDDVAYTSANGKNVLRMTKRFEPVAQD